MWGVFLADKKWKSVYFQCIKFSSFGMIFLKPDRKKDKVHKRSPCAEGEHVSVVFSRRNSAAPAVEEGSCSAEE